MNLIKDEHDHHHRGIIGLESTLIIIAFVIVAAALAFVVLNMGFSTAQKAKTAIGSTLSSTGGTLEVEGKVIASSYRPPGGAPSLNVTSIPIKIALSGDSVNLNPSITAVKYLSNQITYDDIYAGTLNPSTYSSLETATGAAAGVPFNYITIDPFTDVGWPAETTAFTYWSIQSNTNDILEAGEHATLVIAFASSDRPEYLDKIRVELILVGGATLTVERAVPQIYNQVVDLG